MFYYHYNKTIIMYTTKHIVCMYYNVVTKPHPQSLSKTHPLTSPDPVLGVAWGTSHHKGTHTLPLNQSPSSTTCGRSLSNERFEWVGLTRN